MKTKNAATRVLVILGILALPFQSVLSDEQSKKASDTHSNEGFCLSESAIKAIGVRAVFPGAKSPYEIPRKCLVHYQEHIGIYRIRKNCFKLIPIHIPTFAQNSVHFNTKEIVHGDQIACSGLGLLRVAELQAFGGLDGGHAD
jgi:hypothetical protein